MLKDSRIQSSALIKIPTRVLLLRDTPPSLFDIFGLVKQELGHTLYKQSGYGEINYKTIERIVEKFSIPGIKGEDIQDFVKELSDEDFGDKKMNTLTPQIFNKITGYTLSAFINHYAKKDDILKIDISHLSRFSFLGHLKHSKVVLEGVQHYEIDSGGNSLLVNHLGHGIGEYLDGAEIEILGDCPGDKDFGRFMKSGKLILHGDADYGVFRCMKGGEGSIYGKVTHGNVCSGMEGGKATIHGHVGIDTKFFPDGDIILPNVGSESTGGEIHLLGSYEDRGSSNPVIKNMKCHIYHKGKLIH